MQTEIQLKEVMDQLLFFFKSLLNINLNLIKLTKNFTKDSQINSKLGQGIDNLQRSKELQTNLQQRIQKALNIKSQWKGNKRIQFLNSRFLQKINDCLKLKIYQYSKCFKTFQLQKFCFNLNLTKFKEIIQLLHSQNLQICQKIFFQGKNLTNQDKHQQIQQIQKNFKKLVKSKLQTLKKQNNDDISQFISDQIISKYNLNKQFQITNVIQVQNYFIKITRHEYQNQMRQFFISRSFKHLQKYDNIIQPQIQNQMQQKKITQKQQNSCSSETIVIPVNALILKQLRLKVKNSNKIQKLFQKKKIKKRIYTSQQINCYRQIQNQRNKSKRKTIYQRKIQYLVNYEKAIYYFNNLIKQKKKWNESREQKRCQTFINKKKINKYQKQVMTLICNSKRTRISNNQKIRFQIYSRTKQNLFE